MRSMCHRDVIVNDIRWPLLSSHIINLLAMSDVLALNLLHADGTFRVKLLLRPKMVSIMALRVVTLGDLSIYILSNLR